MDKSILEYLKEKYENHIQDLKEIIESKNQEIEFLRQTVSLLSKRPILNYNKVEFENKASSEIMSDSAKKTENIFNDPVGNVAGEVRQIGNVAGEVQGNQTNIQYNYTAEQQQTLTEAAAEIQQLLEQLSQNNPTDTLTQQAIVAEEAIATIENNPTFKERVVKVIKAMGVEMLMEAIDHPVANVLRAGIDAIREEQ